MARWHAIQAKGASSAARGIGSGASETFEATQIKLKISNFSGSIAPQHPISNEFKPTMSLPSRTVVCTQTNRANRSSNWAPVSPRYLWNRSSSRQSSWRRQWNSPSSACLRSGFRAFLGQQVQCSNGGDISHDRRGKRAGWEIPVQNDQAARYKRLKQLYSCLSRLVWTTL